MKHKEDCGCEECKYKKLNVKIEKLQIQIEREIEKYEKDIPVINSKPKETK